MTIGDLVFLSECSDMSRCLCPFCRLGSSRVGIVSDLWTDESDSTSAMVEFDIGEQPFWSSGIGGDHRSPARNRIRDLEVINENW